MRTRQPKGLPIGGQFATVPRLDAAADLISVRDRYLLIDGECPECGKYGEVGYCEGCSPSCDDCGSERESADQSLCFGCEDRRHEEETLTNWLL